MKALPTVLSTLVLLATSVSCSLYGRSRGAELGIHRPAPAHRTAREIHRPKFVRRAELAEPATALPEPSDPDRSRRPVRRPSRMLRNLYFFRG